MIKRTAFRPIAIFFLGLGASLVYGLVGMGLIWYFEGKFAALAFFTAYTTSFKTLISFGLILGTAFVVLRMQKDFPDMINKAFTETTLSKTDYPQQELKFWSEGKTTRFAALMVVVAFVIFSLCSFPLSPLGDIFMIIAACAQYGFASFVGRKLRYAAVMLDSLRDVAPTRNLFKKRELDNINWYVNVTSTLTIIFVYVHVTSYYDGPFAYNSEFGQSVKIFLLFPAIIATPVLLIFNFYPREILRKLYSRSIDFEIKKLRRILANESLSEYEKRSYLIEFDKMSKEELRYSLHLALTDLPIGITILVMLLQPLLK